MILPEKARVQSFRRAPRNTAARGGAEKDTGSRPNLGGAYSQKSMPPALGSRDKVLAGCQLFQAAASPIRLSVESRWYRYRPPLHHIQHAEWQETGGQGTCVYPSVYHYSPPLLPITPHPKHPPPPLQLHSEYRDQTSREARLLTSASTCPHFLESGTRRRVPPSLLWWSW